MKFLYLQRLSQLKTFQLPVEVFSTEIISKHVKQNRRSAIELSIKYAKFMNRSIK